MLHHVALARLASYFLLLSQKKVTKEKATPYRLFPVLLTIMGGNRKLASLKQSIAENSHAVEQHRRGSTGYSGDESVVFLTAKRANLEFAFLIFN